MVPKNFQPFFVNIPKNFAIDKNEDSYFSATCASSLHATPTGEDGVAKLKISALRAEIIQIVSNPTNN